MKIRRHWEWNFILIIVWLFICVISSVFVYSTFKLIISGTKTVWTVTHIQTHYGDEDEATTYSISAMYDCWSKKGVEWNSMWSSSTYRYNIGDKFTLYCDESEPWIFIPKSFTNYLWLLAPLMWILFFVFWIKKIVDKNKRKKLKEELSQFGTKVEATITKIIPYWNVNNQQWYRIEAMNMSDVFLSEEIFADIDRILSVWDKIDVYVDYGDHSRYWMDTDSIFEKSENITTISN